MIKILDQAGRSAPIMECDICGERIDRVGAAAAVFPRSGRDGETLPVLHVHKGPCHDQAEHRLGGNAGAPWQELRHHIVYLLNNIGMDANAQAEATASANNLDQLRP